MLDSLFVMQVSQTRQQDADLNGPRLEEGVDDVLVTRVHAFMQVADALLDNVPQPGFPHTLHQCFYVTQLGLHKANDSAPLPLEGPPLELVSHGRKRVPASAICISDAGNPEGLLCH